MTKRDKHKLTSWISLES